MAIPLSVFEKKYRSEKNPRAKMRAHVLLLRRQKFTQSEIASIVRVTQGTVSNICRRFEKEGWLSTHDKPREGRPVLLTRAQRGKLRTAMQHELVDGDIRRGWQTKDVRSFVHQKFHVRFTDQHLRRIIHAVGMSWKVPRRQHNNRDEKAVRAFKKTSRGRPSLWRPIIPSSA